MVSSTQWTVGWSGLVIYNLAAFSIGEGSISISFRTFDPPAWLSREYFFSNCVSYCSYDIIVMSINKQTRFFLPSEGPKYTKRQAAAMLYVMRKS
jgi:hypothetical protein